MATDIVVHVENEKKMAYANVELTKFLKKEFNLSVNMPYKINNRLKTSLGRFCCTQRRTMINGKYVTKIQSYYIEYNGKFLQCADYEEVAAIGKHEALHYATRVLGLPCTDGQPGFERLLKKYNLPSSTDKRTVERAANLYSQEVDKQPRHFAKCSACNDLVAEWLRKPNLENLNRQVTTCCNAKPIYLGKVAPATLGLKR